ncbi:hypothetical protein TWF481_004367 [Arthrobotrys musiformis]|uniref:Uncharacterized protein n=1 Tax=Arthrobotrys musiformis TaxID=47236 RepID=A0AAV9WLD8_9PEZI
MAPYLLARDQSSNPLSDIDAADVGSAITYFAQKDGLPYVSKLPLVQSLMEWCLGALLFMGFVIFGLAYGKQILKECRYLKWSGGLLASH